MPTDRELVVYGRTTYCPYLATARRVLAEHNIPCREIMIDEDQDAEKRVLAWTGFLSVPTIIIARPGEILPHADPAPLPPGVSPRGIDRGSMITEPYENELLDWLKRGGFLPASPG